MPKKKEQNNKKGSRRNQSSSSDDNNDDEQNNILTPSASSTMIPHILIQNRNLISVVSMMSSKSKILPKMESSSSSIIKIATWNILTQTSIDTMFGSYNPSFALTWKHRFPLIKEQIIKLDADVLCLQEVPTSDGILEEITNWLSSSQLGYKLVSASNPYQRMRKDAVLMAWKHDRLKPSSSSPSSILTVSQLIPGGKMTPVAEEETSSATDVYAKFYSPLMTSSANAGIAVHFTLCDRNKKEKEKEETEISSFIVATTHLSGPKLAEDVRVAEMESFISSIKLHFAGRISNATRPCPLVLAADLNSHPKMRLCRDVLEKKYGFRNVYHSSPENSAFVDKEFTCYMPHYQDCCDFIMLMNNTENCFAQERSDAERSPLAFSLVPASLLQVPSVLDVIKQRNIDAKILKLEKELLFPKFEGLPTVSFPSDHLPIMVEFEMRNI